MLGNRLWVKIWSFSFQEGPRFTSREQDLWSHGILGGAWVWSLRAPPTLAETYCARVPALQQAQEAWVWGLTTQSSEKVPGNRVSPFLKRAGLDMSLGPLWRLKKLTSNLQGVLLWAYTKSLLLQRIILIEVVLGAGVFLRSNIALVARKQGEDSRMAPPPKAAAHPHPLVRKEVMVRRQSHPEVALSGFILC